MSAESFCRESSLFNECMFRNPAVIVYEGEGGQRLRLHITEGVGTVWTWFWQERPASKWSLLVSAWRLFGRGI